MAVFQPIRHSLRTVLRRIWLLGGLLIGGLLIGLNLAAPAIAAPPGAAPTTPAPPYSLLGQGVIDVSVNLSTSGNELKFVPNELEFLPGKRYKLLLSNPSSQKHYFTAKDFADAIWTQKVEVAGVEVKGVIHELELKPGAQAEWLFVPIKPGIYELRCPIKGHTEAGMRGTLTIVAPKRMKPYERSFLKPAEGGKPKA